MTWYKMDIFVGLITFNVKYTSELIQERERERDRRNETI